MLNGTQVNLYDIFFYLTLFACLYQGKEYVFAANADNLGAIVDLSILSLIMLMYMYNISVCM